METSRFSALKREPVFDETLPPANPPVRLIRGARIRFAPGQPTGLHRHPMSTVGVVTEGSFIFEREGEEARVLRAGDGFFEPAGHTMRRFDNASASEPAEILCYYLTDTQQRPAIEMLDGGMDAQLGKDQHERVSVATERRGDDAAASPEQPSQTPITGRETEPPTEAMGVLAEFYRAFNGRDLALMEQNWEASSGAVMDNPLGGIMRGWPSIRAIYMRLFTGTARVTVEFFDYSLHEAGDVLWAIGRERGTLQQEGKPDLPLLIRTSRLFRREGGHGRWRQTHHHGSIDDAKLLADYQARVRGSAGER